MNLLMFDDVPEIYLKNTKIQTCRNCVFRERWQCGSKVISYCAKRKSHRTQNRKLKIKAFDLACNFFKEIEK
jgi:hypothetical protein